MEPLHRATVLNNMGAHLLEVHNTLGAIQAFQEAIHVMKLCRTAKPTTTTTNMDGGGQTATHHHRGNPSSNGSSSNMCLLQSLQCIPSVVIDHTSPSTHPIRSSVLPFNGGSDHNNGHSRTSKEMNNDTNGSYEYYVHDRALILPTTLQPPQHHTKLVTSSITRMDIDLEVQIRNASIIILFNFCISCHQWGKRTGQTATVLQALRMYERVVQMILQQLTPTTPGTFLRVVLCLALNNMVSIHYEFCDYDNGLICIGYIQKMLLRHSETMDTIALEFIPPSDWNDVKLNALLILSPSAAQAA